MTMAATGAPHAPPPPTAAGPLDAGSTPSAAPTSPSALPLRVGGGEPGGEPVRATAAAIAAALAVFVYMLPPTSGVATGSYVGRTNATAPWVLSAQQLSSMAGGFVGIGAVARLDLPLRRALPLGALCTGLGQLTSLAAYALGGNSGSARLDQTPWQLAVLLIEPAASNAFGICGVVPVLALCAAAAEGSGEGGAYGLVAAADAAGALAAGTLSALAVHLLHLGDPPQADSWGALPLFVAACALAKLLAVPGVLLLLRVQEQLRPK